MEGPFYSSYPSAGRRTTTLMEKKYDVGTEPLKCNAHTFITPRVSFKDFVM
jgi:hypothetical protein